MDALLLSAGLGTRLRPLTDTWPKCLMPISGRPLIDYWLLNLKLSGFSRVFINTHWKHKIVEDYLLSLEIDLEIVLLYEPELLGTAATLRSLSDFRDCEALLLAHADNFCDIDFLKLNRFHNEHSAPISMVTFETDNPNECGIVVLDASDAVTEFYEKVPNPPSKQANAAVYIIDHSVIDYVNSDYDITDFSNHVLPNFLNNIKVFKHSGILIDVGSFERLKLAQSVQTDGLKFIYNSAPKWPISIPEYKKIECILEES